jgi:hypothetical protein
MQRLYAFVPVVLGKTDIPNYQQSNEDDPVNEDQVPHDIL